MLIPYDNNITLYVRIYPQSFPDYSRIIPRYFASSFLITETVCELR